MNTTASKVKGILDYNAASQTAKASGCWLDQDGFTAPATAYRDAEGWVLFDATKNVIEDWPAGWPKTVDSAFLKTKGVLLVR